jgi:hypothetical protein
MIWRALTLIGCSITAGIAGVMIGDREPPTVIDKTEILTPVVAPGENLRIRYEVYRRRSCHTRVERILLDGENARFVLPVTELSGAPGLLERDAYVSVIPIPTDATRGVGKYRAITTYKCNVIHSLFWPIIVVGNDAVFTIE